REAVIAPERIAAGARQRGVHLDRSVHSAPRVHAARHLAAHALPEVLRQTVDLEIRGLDARAERARGLLAARDEASPEQVRSRVPRAVALGGGMAPVGVEPIDDDAGRGHFRAVDAGLELERVGLSLRAALAVQTAARPFLAEVACIAGVDVRLEREVDVGG